MSKSLAAELAGHLNGACNALLGSCGRVFLAPVLRRATNADLWWALNKRLQRALLWWEC